MIQSNSEYYTEKAALKLRDTWRTVNHKLDHFLDRPRNPDALSLFIKGAIFALFFLFTFRVFSIIFGGISKIFENISVVIAIWFAVQLGVDKKYKWMVVDSAAQKAERWDEASEEDKEKAQSIMALGAFEVSFDIIFAIATLLAFSGAYVWDFFAFGFPILYDLEFKTDFMKVNIFYWLRTATTFLQFIFMYYIMRRIRRKIKRKINDRFQLEKRMDGFDRSFFAPTI